MTDQMFTSSGIPGLNYCNIFSILCLLIKLKYCLTYSTFTLIPMYHLPLMLTGWLCVYSFSMKWPCCCCWCRINRWDHFGGSRETVIMFFIEFFQGFCLAKECLFEARVITKQWLRFCWTRMTRQKRNKWPLFDKNFQSHWEESSSCWFHFDGQLQRYTRRHYLTPPLAA